jgi:hypothetical protein
MPKLPTDRARAAAYSEKLKAQRSADRAAKEQNAARTEEALLEMRRAFARRQGVDESEVTMIVCRRGR